MSGALTAQQIATVIDLCDAALGEVARRQHRWAWLRPAGSSIDDCLVVEAYYPHNRLVLCDARRDPAQLALCRALIPAHGLALMEVGDAELAQLADVSCVSEALDRLPLPQSQPVEDLSAAPEGQFQTARAAWVAAAPADRGATGPARSEDPAAQRRSGLLLGGALVAVLAIELAAIAIPLAVDGHVLLGIGFLFEALARALGTITAARAWDRRLAWSALIIGSPAVLSFTLLRERHEPPPDPGQLAGVFAALAAALIALALVGMLLGI